MSKKICGATINSCLPPRYNNGCNDCEAATIQAEKETGKERRAISNWTEIEQRGELVEKRRNSQAGDARSLSEYSSLVLLNSLEKERKGVRIIRNHGENIPILSS